MAGPGWAAAAAGVRAAAEGLQAGVGRLAARGVARGVGVVAMGRALAVDWGARVGRLDWGAWAVERQ